MRPFAIDSIQLISDPDLDQFYKSNPISISLPRDSALLKDGTIAGGAIKMIGSDDVTVQGKNLHLNPGETAPPAPGAIPLPFPVALPPIPKPMVGLGVSVAGVARPPALGKALRDVTRTS